MKARLKAILIYLTREGDNVNNRHVRRSDLRLCAHAQSRIVAQVKIKMQVQTFPETPPSMAVSEQNF